MLGGIHILLTYTCPFQCDHCFLYCSPEAKGTFTICRIRNLIDQAAQMDSVSSVSFEGGEPLLYLPTLLSGITYAKESGFSTGVVTNAYTARSDEDAVLLIKMLIDAGLDSLTISDDELHFGSQVETPAQALLRAAEERDLPSSRLSVELPSAESPTGSVMFRGRAADTMAEGVPRSPWESFTECPHENPLDPARVHIDSYGNVHFCQGVVIGNVWKTPLSDLFRDLDLSVHPVCGTLATGGPAALAMRFGFQAEATYVDACHLCFESRRASLGAYPEILTPTQVYGR